MKMQPSSAAHCVHIPRANASAHYDERKSPICPLKGPIWSNSKRPISGYELSKHGQRAPPHLERAESPKARCCEQRAFISALVVARLWLLVREFASRSFSEGWWRGLDSNQRTLARADLQSAAFNHSATSPRGHAGRMLGRRAMWRRGLSLSTREDALSPRALALACAPNFNSPPDCRNLERVKGIEPSS